MTLDMKGTRGAPGSSICGYSAAVTTTVPSPTGSTLNGGAVHSSLSPVGPELSTWTPGSPVGAATTTCAAWTHRPVQRHIATHPPTTTLNNLLNISNHPSII